MEPSHDEPAKALGEGEPRTREMLNDIFANGLSRPVSTIAFIGSGSLQSVFSVSDLAAASVGAAALAIGDLLLAADGRRRDIVVDRRLASFWFALPFARAAGRCLRPGTSSQATIAPKTTGSGFIPTRPSSRSGAG